MVLLIVKKNTINNFDVVIVLKCAIFVQ